MGSVVTLGRRALSMRRAVRRQVWDYQKADWSGLRDALGDKCVPALQRFGLAALEPCIEKFVEQDDIIVGIL